MALPRARHAGDGRGGRAHRGRAGGLGAAAARRAPASGRQFSSCTTRRSSSACRGSTGSGSTTTSCCRRCSRDDARIRLVCCGHVHHESSHRVGAAEMMTTPATGLQFSPDSRRGAVRHRTSGVSADRARRRTATRRGSSGCPKPGTPPLSSRPTGEARDVSTRTALVTGAGRGIGRATALALAAAGARVVATARSGDELDAAVEEITGSRRRGGGDSLRPGRPRRSPSTLIDRAAAIFGPIDILVNNAGIGSSADPRPARRLPGRVLGPDARAEPDGALSALEGGAAAHAGAALGAHRHGRVDQRPHPLARTRAPTSRASTASSASCARSRSSSRPRGSR